MRRTKRNILSYFLVLLMVCTAFAFEPIPARAATTYTVSTEAELTSALARAVDGDVIIVSNEEVYNLFVTEPVIINKSITLDLQCPLHFQQTYDEYGNPTNNLPEAVVVIDSCDVKIIGTNHTISGANEVYAYKVIDNSGNAKLTFETTGFLGDGVYIVDDSSNSYMSSLVVNKGNYNIPTGRTSAFTFSDGTSIVNSGNLVINGGTFNENVAAYLGENTVVYNDYGSYEVRSTVMSEQFKNMLTDGKLIVNSVAPEDEMNDGMAYVQGALVEYSSADIEFYPGYIEDGVYDISAYDTKTGEQIEIHRVEVVFDADIDSDDLAVAENFITEYETFPNYEEETSYWQNPNTGATESWTEINSYFKIADMEVVNMWANGYDVNNVVHHRHTVNYSGELKECLGNANIDFRVTMIGAGADTDLYLDAAGDAVILIDDVMYTKVPGCVHAEVQHIIYVPDGTAPDANSLKSAAQKRINEYLGSDSKVVVSYGGAFNTLSNPEWNPVDADYQAEMLDELGITTAPEHYFIATSGNKQYKFLIIPDSSKMITPTYKTVDATSNVTITSTSADIPLDTSIRASELTSGTTYNDIIDTLGVEENVTFDLKLYSYSTANYISSLDNDVFEVSIPIPETFKDKTLMAYYVGDDGKITKYPAEVVKVGDKYYAVFETDHFSIYTIAEGVADVCDVNGASHKLTAVPAKAATTTAEGNKAYWTCDCGKWFADADGKTEITDKTSVVIPKLKDTTVTTTEDTTEDVADGSPATGDNTNIVLLFGMMLISMGAIFAKKKAD